jgi:hypothetical protein
VYALGKLVTIPADPAFEDQHTQTAADSPLRDCHPAAETLRSR